MSYQFVQDYHGYSRYKPAWNQTISTLLLYVADYTQIDMGALQPATWAPTSAAVLSVPEVAEL